MGHAAIITLDKGEAKFNWVQLLSFTNGTLLAFLPRITRIFTNFSLTFVSIRGEMTTGETRAITPNSIPASVHVQVAHHVTVRSVT